LFAAAKGDGNNDHRNENAEEFHGSPHWSNFRADVARLANFAPIVNAGEG
jgi:hypothetical protein